MVYYRCTAFAALVAVILLPTCWVQAGQPDGKVLRFSAIPDQDAEELKREFQPIAKYLSNELGIPVKFVPSVSYPDSVEKFVDQDILLAWFGGLTGVQAREAVPGARAIVQGKEDPNYFSYFIANAETGLEESDDFPQGISNFTFTYGSEQSTSGRLMPQYFIEKFSGERSEDFFKKGVTFSGDHDTTCEMVESGEADVGVLSYKTYDERVEEGLTDPTVTKVIWKTPPYPDYSFTAHPKLDKRYGDGFIDKLQKVLINMDDPALLAALPRDGLIEATSDDFKMIEEIADEIGLVGI